MGACSGDCMLNLAKLMHPAMSRAVLPHQVSLIAIVGALTGQVAFGLLGDQVSRRRTWVPSGVGKGGGLMSINEGRAVSWALALR